MRMAVHQFPADAVDHVRHGETALFRLDLGVEHHLHQHIPQLLAEPGHVAVVDGLHRLAGLLQKIPPDGLVVLLPVPGASPRFPE